MQAGNADVTDAENPIASTQVPAPGLLTIDHVAHFVPDADAASAALTQLGFTLTPFSPQSHRLEPGGPVVPAGTGNRCVMLQRGYLEFLTPTGQTPIADQLRAAIQRYIGVHLIAFGTASPDTDHARLTHAGFDPATPIALERPIATEQGKDIARFTVVRVPPGRMPEGRIQYCHQRTPALVWQRRWLEHRNGMSGLAGVLICVDDPAAAAARYALYTGLGADYAQGAWRVATARGVLTFVDPSALERYLGISAPVLPWIAGYALESKEISATRDALRATHADMSDLPERHLLVRLPPALGGIMIVSASDSSALRFD